jgi:replicative DNA helicase
MSALDYNPPHDLEAEKALLGSLLLNSKLLEEVADKLKPDYFFDRKNQIVYQIILDLWLNSQPVDVLFVLNALQNNLRFNATEVGTINREYLLELIAKSSLSSSPEHTARIIKEKYILRTLIRVGDNLKTLAVESNSPVEDILDNAQKQLYEIALDNLDKNFVRIGDLLTATFERINELYTNQVKYRGIPTGFVDLDNMLGGLHHSDLIILAARPSMGKTSLALEIVKRVALQQQIGVAVFSLEMSRDQLCDKLIASVSGIELRKIRSGQLEDSDNLNEFTKLGEAIGRLEEAPIWIDDSGSLNIMELRTKARRLKSRHNIGLIVIDYLQLMSGKNYNYQGNRVQEVSDISRGLKMLAKELNIPVLALSQLSRGVEGREDKRPLLSDLRESGSIEQDADVVLFIHREEMYSKDTKKKGIAEILISKHRNGETGVVELAWIPKLATFENLQGARIRSVVDK